jgi:hypothetical protein
VQFAAVPEHFKHYELQLMQVFTTFIFINCPSGQTVEHAGIFKDK